MVSDLKKINMQVTTELGSEELSKVAAHPNQFV